MNTSEKFYRFAAECEFMAKLTHNPKNKNYLDRHGREMDTVR
jgi:hypothetical protein